jgi:hypothetical protein
MERHGVKNPVSSKREVLHCPKNAAKPAGGATGGYEAIKT